MKEIIKVIVTTTIRLARNLFFKRFYRKQIRRKFLRKTDSLPNDYKSDVLKYWKSKGFRIDTSWHKWYSSRNGIADVRYIPEDFYYCKVEPALNKEEFSVPLGDKSMFGFIMSDIKRPHTFVMNINGMFFDENFKILSREEAVESCICDNEIVFKPTLDTGGGRKIEFLETGSGNKAAASIKRLFEKFHKDFIVQASIKQHDELNRLNPDSVNTLKVMSLLHKDEVHILSTIIRVGLKGQRVDNLTIGGHSVGVDSSGFMRELCFTKDGRVSSVLPNGYVLKGKSVPGYKKAVEMVKKAHCRLGQFRLVSWDIAIDPFDEPILIEYNLFYQGINIHQLNNGPLFGSLTDEILETLKK